MSIAGLTVDNSDLLSIAPSVVLYGAPGGGKSTEMARAFPNVLYVQSSPTILRALAQYAKEHPEAGIKVPARVTFDENYVAERGGSVVAAFRGLLESYLIADAQGKNPYEGIVFDEWSTISERLYAEMRTDPTGKYRAKNGNVNIFAVMDGFKVMHSTVLSIARRTRKIVGFVSHHQPPKWDEDENSMTRGQLKHPGGPRMPMGLADQVIAICADADVVLQLAVLDPVKGGIVLDPTAAQAPSPEGSHDFRRVFMTQLEQKWFRKVRGAFDLQREELIDIKKGRGLRELLRRSGYPV